MNSEATAPFVSRPGAHLVAGALALGVHVAFVLLLVFGVSWQTREPAPVMVDLWQALPAPTIKPAPPPKPAPAPKPVPAPEPVKAPAPKPAPKPKVVEPPPKAPDIALEKKKAEAERNKQLQAMQAAAAEKARAEAARAQAEAARAAQQKQLAEQKKNELLRQMEEEDLVRRMADETAASEARRAQLAQAAAASKRQVEVDSVVGQYRDLISAKVRGNTRLPANLTGSPAVRCVVRLLPTGEVQTVRVTQSSGNAAYDDAVVRAIYKSSPLPLPSERDARAVFVPELAFVHRPAD